MLIPLMNGDHKICIGEKRRRRRRRRKGANDGALDVHVLKK